MSGTDESRRWNPYLFPRGDYVQFPYCYAATSAGAVLRSQYRPMTGRTSGMNR